MRRRIGARLPAPTSPGSTGESKSTPVTESSGTGEPPTSLEPGSPTEALPAGTATSEPAAPFRFFSGTSFWNKQLSATAPLNASSAAYIAAFDKEIAQEEEDKKGPFINTTEWSVPIYTVPASQAEVKVALVGARSARTLQAAWDSVSLPSNAQPAAGTDKHLVVWQPSSDMLWEFWRLEKAASGWQAEWGGAIKDVSGNPGVYGPEAWEGAEDGWGASATSLSMAGGLITLEDLQLGQINHALAIGIPNPRAGSLFFARSPYRWQVHLAAFAS